MNLVTGVVRLGESIRVCLRVRPMNSAESGRGDQCCTLASDSQQCILSSKYLLALTARGVSKSYRFNVVLDEHKYQDDTFVLCCIPVPPIITCSNWWTAPWTAMRQPSSHTDKQAVEKPTRWFIP